jgi:CRISPR/Cas system CSM-associated protein Csm2 small subunit
MFTELKKMVKVNVETIKKAFGKKENVVIDFDELPEESKQYWRDFYSKQIQVNDWEDLEAWQNIVVDRIKMHEYLDYAKLTGRA